MNENRWSSQILPKDKSSVSFANWTAWKGEITGPDFVSVFGVLRGGYGEGVGTESVGR